MPANRTHQVSGSLTSGPEGSPSFREAERLATKLERYARRLGFNVMHENVDEDLTGAPTAEILDEFSTKVDDL